MSERQGIEIDYCQQCRGVWLDRGELDKIIERSIVDSSVRNSESNHASKHSAPHYSQQHSHNEYYKKKKKESFLSDLFDF